MGFRIGEKQPDRFVQSLRLAQDDVHQLRLFPLEWQLVFQHLDRTGHRRQRVADFVRDSGGHLTDRCQPLLKTGFTLESFELGDVLKDDEKTGRSLRKLQRRQRQSQNERLP